MAKQGYTLGGEALDQIAESIAITQGLRRQSVPLSVVPDPDDFTEHYPISRFQIDTHMGVSGMVWDVTGPFGAGQGEFGSGLNPSGSGMSSGLVAGRVWAYDPLTSGGGTHADVLELTGVPIPHDSTHYLYCDILNSGSGAGLFACIRYSSGQFPASTQISGTDVWLRYPLGVAVFSGGDLWCREYQSTDIVVPVPQPIDDSRSFRIDVRSVSGLFQYRVGPGYVVTPEGEYATVSGLDWTGISGDLDVFLNLSLDNGSLSGTLSPVSGTLGFADVPASLVYNVGSVLTLNSGKAVQVVQDLNSDVDLTGSIVPAWPPNYYSGSNQLLTHSPGNAPEWAEVPAGYSGSGSLDPWEYEWEFSNLTGALSGRLVSRSLKLRDGTLGFETDEPDPSGWVELMPSGASGDHPVSGVDSGTYGKPRRVFFSGTKLYQQQGAQHLELNSGKEVSFAAESWIDVSGGGSGTTEEILDLSGYQSGFDLGLGLKWVSGVPPKDALEVDPGFGLGFDSGGTLIVNAGQGLTDESGAVAVNLDVSTEIDLVPQLQISGGYLQVRMKKMKFQFLSGAIQPVASSNYGDWTNGPVVSGFVCP